MKTITIILAIYTATILTGCDKNELSFLQNDFSIEIEAGEHYLHDFPVMMGIKIKNPPQLVIWAEDTSGNYLTTIYCTYRSATATWRKSPGESVPSGGIRRESALPYWAHKWRAHQNQSGTDTDAYTGATSKAPVMPDKNNQLTDGITGATQKEGFTLKLSPNQQLETFCILVEVNQSTDFNEAFPSNARKGNLNYSGGEYGSGQPALVYKLTINNIHPVQNYGFELAGHSSPDGTTGDLYSDLTGITTASQIISEIKLTQY